MSTVSTVTGDQPGTRGLAFVLAVVSGFVDGVGATYATGVFVSFMSGNTTSTGIALGHGRWDKVAYAGAPVVLYVAGTVVGALMLRRSRRGRLPVLVLAAALLAAFAVERSVVTLPPVWADTVLFVLLVVPMALLNTCLRTVAGATVGLGYVTGTLVSLGEACAAAIAGERRPGQVALFAGLWICFLGGAALGAIGVDLARAWAVLLPAAVLVVLLTRPSSRTPRAVLRLG